LQISLPGTAAFWEAKTAIPKQAAEKLISVEGDGLQAVRNFFEMNSALAAGG
jgi:hypothetical protein